MTARRTINAPFAGYARLDAGAKRVKRGQIGRSRGSHDQAAICYNGVSCRGNASLINRYCIPHTSLCANVMNGAAALKLTLARLRIFQLLMHNKYFFYLKLIG